MKQRILVTGTSGFIGKSIIELLDATKYEIIPINHDGWELTSEYQVDGMFETYPNIDYVIHCATVGGRRNKPETPHVFLANVDMFNNLIKHKDKYRKLITFGSGAELSEGDFPLNYYGLSKKYITEKIKRENLNCIVLRLWGCFGKYETEDRFIKANLMRYHNREDFIIHNNKIMDFFYVNDIIPVLEFIFSNLYYPHKVISLCYEGKYSLSMICGIINKINNYKVNIPKVEYEQNYCNMHYGMEIDEFKFNFIGLEKGIQEVYGSL